MFLEEAPCLEPGFVKPKRVGICSRRPGQHIAVGGESGFGLAGLGQRSGALAGCLVAPIGRGGEVGGQTGVDGGSFRKAFGFAAAQSEKCVRLFHQGGMANLWRRVAAEGAVVKSKGVGQAAVAQKKRGLLEAGAVPQG